LTPSGRADSGNVIHLLPGILRSLFERWKVFRNEWLKGLILRQVCVRQSALIAYFMKLDMRGQKVLRRGKGRRSKRRVDRNHKIVILS
jgi:hypothetical protein